MSIKLGIMNDESGIENVAWRKQAVFRLGGSGAA
jgi:hypothetical protein